MTQRSNDLSEQESERKYRTLVNTMQDGAVILQNGRIRFANQALADMLGSSVEGLKKRPYADFIDPDELEEAKAFFRDVAGSTAPQKVELLVRPDNEKEPIIVQMKLVQTEYRAKRAYMGTVVNVTSRRQHENELKRAKEAAEAANRAKSAFLANMSHELRTPLNAIIGYSEMLEEDAVELEQEMFVPDLHKIQRAGRHLLELINDILDLSKIEAGKMDLFVETFSVSELLEDVVATIRPLVEKNKNHLVLEHGHVGLMRADKTKLRQTLFNLLSNASKFTEAGTITLRTKRERLGSEGEWIQFDIVDTGIGIPPSKLENLFEPFTQADASTTRKYGGTGLGLAISRRFCNMMGGDIVVESEEGEGTTFTVYLPTDPNKGKQLTADFIDAHAEFVESDESNSAESMGTVLVIDDDPVARDLLRRHLVKEGFEVITAVNGQEGLKIAAERQPDAITLDVLLPSMDGWAVLSAMKEDPTLADIPVIIVTMVEQKQIGFALGAADYLLKPIDKQQLLQILERYRTVASPMFSSEPSVLIVEDDPAIRDLMERALSKEGWEVAVAENGRVALTQLEQHRSDLILLDLMMPEMDGFQFVEELRQRPAWQTIPVVVMTAKELSVQERQNLNGYVKDVVQKGDLERGGLFKQVADLVRQYMKRETLAEKM